MSSEERRNGGDPGHGRTPLRTLRAGRHKLHPEQVRDHQRARLIAAIADLCAERGYANVVISDIVARAAVSKSTFYGVYETKANCLFDAHKYYSALLLARIDTARKGLANRSEILRAAIQATLSFSTESPSAAQLLTTGILSAGPEGRSRYWTTIEAAAKRLCATADPPPRRHSSALAGALFAAPTITASLELEDPAVLLDLEGEFLELALRYAERA